MAGEKNESVCPGPFNCGLFAAMPKRGDVKVVFVSHAIFPIPGTRQPQRIDEKAKAADILLDAATLKRIDEPARPGLAEGATLL